MGLLSGGLIIGRLFGSEMWGLIFGKAIIIIIFFLWGGGGSFLSEFYGSTNNEHGAQHCSTFLLTAIASCLLVTNAAPQTKVGTTAQFPIRHFLFT